MKRLPPIIAMLGACAAFTLFGQTSPNCFLEDFESKDAEIPPYVDAVKPETAATVTIHCNAGDTVAQVSKYIYGANANIYSGNFASQPDLINHIKLLSPHIIRFPGGLHSNEYFWNASPGNFPSDLPEKLVGNDDAPYWGPGFNTYWEFRLDDYYAFLDATGCEGLITVNYSYARYGTGPTPVQTAAKLAADWVRYDDGRTTFWEIGNENCASWASGYKIDTALNQDGQPEIITPKLYGQHVQVFVDSMKKAAEEIGHTIYIGAQNYVGMLEGAGNSPDWLVDHDYFTPYQQNSNAKVILDSPPSVTKSFAAKAISETQKWGTDNKPITLTEWNIFAEGSGQRCSFINGMHAVMVLGEMANNAYGMANRWDIANDWSSGQDMGMFYKGSGLSVPNWTPYPPFFYMYYFQKFFGDHAIRTTAPAKSEVVAYASLFVSGHAGIIVVNKGTTEQTIKLDIEDHGVGDRYYIYSLTGGDDNGEFSQVVYINDYTSDYAIGGPIEDLEDIEAYAYPIGNEIKFTSPGRSVQFVLIEDGERDMAVQDDGRRSGEDESPAKVMIYPTPARESLKIDLKQGGYHRIDIVNIQGSVVYSGSVNPVQRELQLSPQLPSGYYFVRLSGLKKTAVSKLIICK